MRAATLLGSILRFRKCTKTPLKYVHTNSKYWHIVAITASDTQEQFTISERNKIRVETILLHSSGVKSKIRWPWHKTCQSNCLITVKMNQICFASQCGLHVRTYMNLESVTSMVDYANIMLTSLRIRCNYIIYSFGEHANLPEEAVHNLVTG